MKQTTKEQIIILFGVVFILSAILHSCKPKEELQSVVPFKDHDVPRPLVGSGVR